MVGVGNNWKFLPLNSDLNETRSGGGDDNSVFQVVPKFSVEREFAVPFEKSRKVHGFVCGTSSQEQTQVGLAVESDFFIFDTEFENVVRQITFEGSIDFTIWSEKLMIVGLSSSAIVFMHPTTFEQLEIRLADEEAETVVNRNARGRFYVGGSIDIQESVCYLQALNVEGKVYRFTTPVGSENTLDYTQLEKTVMAEPTLVLEYLMPLIIHGQTITSCVFLSTSFLVTAEMNGALTILDTGFAGFQISACEDNFQYRLNNRVNLIKDLCLDHVRVTIKKIALAEGLLFALLSSGALEILLDQELFPTEPLKLPTSSARVYDFALVGQDHNLKLWVIFGNPEHFEESYVGVFAGTRFEPVLTMPLPLSLTKESSGSEKFTELKFSQTSAQERPDAILGVTVSGKTKMFQLLESSTESTFEQLLSQKKFEQANAFAEKYAIDIDLVRRAKAEALYVELQMTSDASIFTDLVSTLVEISDANFVCEFCSRDALDSFSDIQWVKKLLDVGRSKVSQVNSPELAEALLLLIKKFHTFSHVFPEGTVREWRDFCRPDHSMFQVCQLFLLNKQFGKCNFLWTRHSEEFVPSLTVGSFVQFFWALFSEQLASSDSITLFATILPDALGKFTDAEFDVDGGVSGLIGLIKKQLGFLEMKREWPGNATSFIGVLTKIYRDEASALMEASIQPGQEEEHEVRLRVCQQVIAQLLQIAQALKEISELIGNYALRIKFTDFFQDNLEDVVNSMLEELFEHEEILRFVQNFLDPFAQRNRLNVDELFSNHIKSKVGDLIYFQNMECIPYERRLLCLVGLIKGLKTKLSSALLIVQNLPVPWSLAVQTFVSDVLNLSLASLSEDRDECLLLRNDIAGVQKQVPFQCLLMKYQLKATGVQSKTGVWVAVKKILMADRYSEECRLKDCKELVKFTGKMEYDAVLTLKVRMTLDSDETDRPTEDLIPHDLPYSAMERLRDRCLLMFPDCFNQPRLYSPHQIQRYLEAAEILCRRLGSEEELEFLKVRKIVPGFNRFSKMFHPHYPLVVVEYMVESMLKSSVEDVKSHAERLSTTCMYPYQELLVTLIFLMMERGDLEDSELIDKVWKLLSEVVSIPGCTLRSTELLDLVLWGVPILMFQNPHLNTKQQEFLEKFLRICAISFDESPYRLSQLIAVHRIFMSLRTKEIPLEEEFLNVIRDIIGFVTMEVKPAAQLLQELNVVIKGLIRYGDSESITAVISFLTTHHVSVKGQTLAPDATAYCDEVLQSLKNVNDSLQETIRNSNETETDPRVRELVEALNRAGFHVNAYALRHRNKKRLVSDLLRKREYRLAAEVGLVFQHRDKEQWASILKGYIHDGNNAKLKGLLKTVKNITELWVIPEFATAWLKVSEDQPEFKNMCPIPLT